MRISTALAAIAVLAVAVLILANPATTAAQQVDIDPDDADLMAELTTQFEGHFGADLSGMDEEATAALTAEVRAAFGAQGKVWLCHVQGGASTMISVDPNALGGHAGHDGDQIIAFGTSIHGALIGDVNAAVAGECPEIGALVEDDDDEDVEGLVDDDDVTDEFRVRIERLVVDGTTVTDVDDLAKLAVDITVTFGADALVWICPIEVSADVEGAATGHVMIKTAAHGLFIHMNNDNNGTFVAFGTVHTGPLVGDINAALSLHCPDVTVTTPPPGDGAVLGDVDAVPDADAVTDVIIPTPVDGVVAPAVDAPQFPDMAPLPAATGNAGLVNQSGSSAAMAMALAILTATFALGARALVVARGTRE